jgi:hypothetical protein
MTTTLPNAGPEADDVVVGLDLDQHRCGGAGPGPAIALSSLLAGFSGESYPTSSTPPKRFPGLPWSLHTSTASGLLSLLLEGFAMPTGPRAERRQ